MTWPLEVWRGGVASWECDEMGHMNVRFYLSRFSEGLVGLAAALGLPKAMTAAATATLRLDVQHLRFLREAGAGTPLHMNACLLEIGESTATVLMVLFHSRTGTPASACRLTVSHATPAGRVFPWPQLTRERAQGLMAEAPAYALPRSLGPRAWTAAASLETARRIGMIQTAAGAVSPTECDAFGRMRPEGYMARLSQSVIHDNAPLKTALEAHPPEGLSAPSNLGGAMVEYRVVFNHWPVAGDGVQVWSGMTLLDGSSRRMAYWIIDPSSGQAFAALEAVYLTFDLGARRALKLPPGTVAELQSLVIPQLAS
jgi:acyl-CoA thioester hydrolase